MFENFYLNQNNFINELEIIGIIKAYRQKLSMWHESQTKKLYNMKAEKILLDLPISSFNTIGKSLDYTILIKEELESLKKVIFIFYNKPWINF